jgi:hypothetical protein
MANLPKFNSKGCLDFPGMLETSQPNVPANATRVHNPMGMVSEAPPGTIYTNADGGAGGDGRQFNYDSRDGDKWNRNPMPQSPEPDIYGAAPYILPISRKLKK